MYIHNNILSFYSTKKQHNIVYGIMLYHYEGTTDES